MHTSWVSKPHLVYQTMSGAGECTRWRIGHRVPLLGAMWSGVMVRCHCWVPLLGGVNAHVGGLDVPSDSVPLLAIAGCHCLGGGGRECTRWRMPCGQVPW